MLAGPVFFRFAGILSGTDFQKNADILAGLQFDFAGAGFRLVRRLAAVRKSQLIGNAVLDEPGGLQMVQDRIRRE